MIVMLACATGLTIPITVSIILILRARGVCCVSTIKHHPVGQPDKRTTTAADGSTPSANGNGLFTVAEEGGSPPQAPPPGYGAAANGGGEAFGGFPA